MVLQAALTRSLADVSGSPHKPPLCAKYPGSDVLQQKDEDDSHLDVAEVTVDSSCGWKSSFLREAATVP